MACEHFVTRQARIVIFLLKKNHLRSLMVRTIEVAREERERAKFFRIWQTALRSRENHWYSAKVSTVPRQR